jgi:hypothetical protein
MRTWFFIGLSCFWLLNSSQIQAGPIATPVAPTISVRIEEPDARTWHFTPTDDDLQPSAEVKDAFELKQTRNFSILGNRTQLTIDRLQFDPDPFVLNNLLVTNTTDSTQVFSVFVGLPTTFAAPSVTSGHVRVSVIDGESNGATFTSVASQPIYAAQIDGTTVATLHDDPYSISAPNGSSAGSPLATFGPSTNAIPVASSIGVQLQFTLTSRDTVSILSRFEVVERGIIVPEPTFLGLALPGLLLTSLPGNRCRHSHLTKWRDDHRRSMN